MTDMTKYEAERVMGLEGSYMLSDLKKAYRKLVKTNHPDAGGSEEQMIALNKAYEKLEDLFGNDKSKIFSCDAAPAEYESNESEYASNAADASYTAYDEAPNTSSWESVEAKAKRERAERNMAGNGSNKAYWDAAATRKKADAEAAKMYAGAKPAWWRTIDKIIGARFSGAFFKAVLAIIGGMFIASAFVGAYGTGSQMYLVAFAVGITCIVNIFNGCITDDLRKAVRWAIDTRLRIWQREKA